MSSLITINSDGSTLSPTLVLGYQTQRDSQNIIHDIIGGGIAVVLIRPRPRAGTLDLLFLDEADAKAALDAHAAETTFTLTDSDRASIQMTYVVEGPLDLRLDDTTRSRWVLSVGYQEVEL